jgi:transcriptional regulator with XRE-family HTH domain
MKLKVGNKLKLIREEKRLSHEQMAEFLNMASSTYGRLERNETQMDMETLAKVSQKLNVPIQEFLPETFHITTHHQGNGNVGFVMGNYVYYGVDESSKTLALENEKLRQENSTLMMTQASILEEFNSLKNELKNIKSTYSLK